MSHISKSVLKHWPTLVLLMASVVLSNWVVTHFRSPGSMTVVEAQGMDMTAMKPPLGPQPVAVEAAAVRSLDGGASYPAVVSALNDEDVVARVPGRIQRLFVYPGDKVVAGQLLGLIDAAEYAAQAAQMRAETSAKASDYASAEWMRARANTEQESASASLDAARAGKARASIDVGAASLELQKSRTDLESMKAARAEQSANLTYADQSLKRQAALYKEGAISLDEYQASKGARDAAAARVANADAAIGGATQAVNIAVSKLASARQSSKEADAQLGMAQAGLKQAQQAAAQSITDANTKRFESQSAGAAAAGAAALANYRELRALSDGEVSERVVSPGTAVMAGQTVLRLKSLGLVRVQADVPQGLAQTAKVGAPVTVLVDSLSRTGKLTSVFPTVDPDTRTFRVEALLPNRDGALKPGMYARLRLDNGAGGVLAIRAAAVQNRDGASFVWTLNTVKGSGKTDWTCTMHPQVSEPGPGKCPICGMDLVQRERGGNLAAHRVKVEVGQPSGDYVRVISGLREGDKVIWAGFENLVEGTPVQGAEWGADGPKTLPAPPQGGDQSMPGMDMSPKKDSAPPINDDDSMKGMDMGSSGGK